MTPVSANGRPLRFFGLLLLGWIITRLTIAGNIDYHSPLMQQAGTASAQIPPRPPLMTLNSSSIILRRSASTGPRSAHLRRPDIFRDETEAYSTMAANTDGPRHYFPSRTNADVMHSNFHPVSDPPPTQAAPSPPLAAPLPTKQRLMISDRWRVSTWLLWRPGKTKTADLASIGRLGASQAGMRLDFNLTQSTRNRLAAYARATSALELPRAPEAAIGLSYQPARVIPVNFAIERRFALDDHARNAMSLLLVGGFGPTRIAGPLTSTGYVQAGMVGFRSQDLFIDGRLALLAPMPNSAIQIGGGLSGGAQPQVERLDIGPLMQIRLPLQKVAARIDVEWRQRIAGQAAPASGLAVTLAADF